MIKMMKVIGLVAMLFTTVDRASALSFGATAPSELYVLTNMSGFTLSGNVIFDSAANAPVYVTSSFSLGNGATFSELITGLISGSQYHTILNVSGSGSPTVVGETISAVPLPAGFPLFGLALAFLGVFGYLGVRRNRNVTGNMAVSA